MKPPIVVVTITRKDSAKRDPKWNYAEYLNIFTKKTTAEPCCLKAKPCQECA